jgi:anti-sigma regulatory factor (Ser/Thr protein kinase)
MAHASIERCENALVHAYHGWVKLSERGYEQCPNREFSWLAKAEMD